jgi:hypothetical protein
LQFLEFAVLGMMVASTALVSCKKGEGDPFLSLHSRKGRLAGEWKMAADSKDHYKSSSLTVDNAYDGANATSTVTVGSSTSTSTRAYTLTWTIEKDGTFTSVETDDSGSNQQTTTSTGTWNFTAGVGEDKKKDHVVFYILSQTVVNASGTSTTTWTGDQNSTVFELHTLKNKELVVVTTSTQTTGTQTIESSSEYHFAQ